MMCEHTATRDVSSSATQIDTTEWTDETLSSNKTPSVSLHSVMVFRQVHSRLEL